MQRTPSWLVVAVAALQLAALGLCAWIMGSGRRPALQTARAASSPPPRAVSPAAGIPAFLTEGAEGPSVLAGGAGPAGALTVGLYRDGGVRLVDWDGARYAGVAYGDRARLRELDGTRAFTIRFTPQPGGRLQATFTGGAHDAQTIALAPLAGWNAA